MLNILTGLILICANVVFLLIFIEVGLNIATTIFCITTALAIFVTVGQVKSFLKEKRR